jgi:glycosyltransferase involved in cell wall biosynthesis
MRLLFFSPYCGQTGSELVLYQLIQKADRTNIKMAVACGDAGELRNTFPRDVRVFSNNSFAHRFSYRAFKLSIRLIHQRVRPDAWYINTIVQPNVLALARELRIPCVLHTHELETMLAFLKPEDIECMINYPKLIIAGSECAAEVMRVLGRRENLEVCYEPIDISRIKIGPQKSMAIRQALSIPPDAFVWAMSGTRDPNKNPERFVRIAAELLKQEPLTYFLWIRGKDTGYSLYAEALAKRLNIDDKIFWIPEKIEDYLNHLDAADGFVLTSYRESFSLVTLEAAALGKPFVSFNSGGPKEIFRNGMGAIVDSWNVNDMVTTMLQVMRGDIYVNADISRARAAEFDISVIVKRWESIILKYITE